MAGTIKRIAGPAFIANSPTNIYTPPASTIYTVIRHIHIANVDTSARTFSLYVGATGASTGGTQLFGTRSIAPNSELDYYCTLLMLSTDFLVGIASQVSTLVITVEGETGTT